MSNVYGSETIDGRLAEPGWNEAGPWGVEKSDSVQIKNMAAMHTDCPTIERFAWQEPNHLMASAIFYMKDGRLLLHSKRASSAGDGELL